jgi:hypothetical protein
MLKKRNLKAGGRYMSTFYVLPPRPIIGERFAAYLGALFPGLRWDSHRWPELGEMLGSIAGDSPDVYVLYREELSPGTDVGQALHDGFGAEAGDEVIEIRADAQPGELRTRRWRLFSTDPGPGAEFS